MPDEPTSTEEFATLLTRVEEGDPSAASELLPQVYDALHALASRSMRHEPAGHTLQATALVSEAYVRLVGSQETGWNGRGHFYGAAAQAMRRILVERARRQRRIKHGGDRKRVPLADMDRAEDHDPTDMIALDEALAELESVDPRAANVVMMRYFAGLSNGDTAKALDMTERTVRRTWSHARLWLYDRMNGNAPE